MNRAEQIIAELDRLTQELKDLAGEKYSPAYRQVEHIRTSMGFEKGGYIGETSLSEMAEDGMFDLDRDEEEEE